MAIQCTSSDKLIVTITELMTKIDLVTIDMSTPFDEIFWCTFWLHIPKEGVLGFRIPYHDKVGYIEVVEFLEDCLNLDARLLAWTARTLHVAYEFRALYNGSFRLEEGMTGFKRRSRKNLGIRPNMSPRKGVCSHDQ